MQLFLLLSFVFAFARSQDSLCNPNPCRNLGGCSVNPDGRTIRCLCYNGWTGDRCQQPCVDVYKSCERWYNEHRCEKLRPKTDWFDINCPVKCSRCVVDPSTVPNGPPLAPVLEPLEFLVGKWTMDSSDNRHFPVNFQQGDAYRQEFEFMTAAVPMFGIPCFNYTSTSISRKDSNDVHEERGFITVKPDSKPLKVALMTTGNNGYSMLEEGLLETNSHSITLKSKFGKAMQKVVSQMPVESERTFSNNGNYMQVKIVQKFYDGKTNEYEQIFYPGR